MRYTAKDVETLKIGEEYWVAWHHCYQIYRAKYIGINPTNEKLMFETNSSGVQQIDSSSVDFYYLCSTEIEARRALIQEIEKTLADSKAYLQKLIEKSHKTL